MIEVIGRDLPESSPAREVWKEVQQEMRHIQRILNDLLDYARPRSPEFHAADLNATAEHAVKLARQQVLSRPIEIEMIPAKNLPPVEHDPAQIQQVLLNLLLNAIQAIDGSRPGGGAPGSARRLRRGDGEPIPGVASIPANCPIFSGRFSPPRGRAPVWASRSPSASCRRTADALK